MPTRIYHWKHGWIPLDHAAALSKAKGSDMGARRYLASSHAAGHAHASVVSGAYGGGTHERGLQPVAAGHLPREAHITAAFSPTRRQFGLLDSRGQRVGLTNEFDGKAITASIPEHLAEHFQARGHTIVGLRETKREGRRPGYMIADHRVVVRTKSGDLKSFAASGSDIHQVDPQVIDVPAKSAAGAADAHVATHEVLVRTRANGKSYGVIKGVGFNGGVDIINADLAGHINENQHKVIGYERRILTTVGKDGVIRRFKADGSNMHKPVIAKTNPSALSDIGEWKAVHPHQAIPTAGPVPINSIKVQRAYRKGNKTVLIEPKMTNAETEAFLNHVSQAFAVTGPSTDHPVTVHVPSGDRNFAGGRTHGYVYRGDSTRVHVAPSVAKSSVDRATGDASGFHMHSAGGVHPALYTLTHELGHVVDNRNGHTFAPQEGNKFSMLAKPEAAALHREHKANLSRYGQTKPVEGYAEAFAHHHLAEASAAAASPHDVAAAAYASRYGWRKGVLR